MSDFETDETSSKSNIQTALENHFPSDLIEDLEFNDKDYQANYFFFTINNYSIWQKREIPKLKYVTEYLFQQEKGEQGTPHLQGYLFCAERQRAKKIQKDLRGDFFITRCKNKERVKIYCSKPKSRDGSIFSNILVPRHATTFSSEQLRPNQKGVIDYILHREPDRRSFNVYYGDGNIGKTTILRYMAINHPLEMCQIPHCKERDIISFVCKQHEKGKLTYCRAFILNLTMKDGGEFPVSALEQLKDGVFATGKYEGASAVIPFMHIIIFANHKPWNLEDCASDRWVLHDF